MRETLADRVARFERVANAPPLYCVRRPLHIYDRGDESDGKAHPVLVEERPHIDVLISPDTGARSVLRELTDPRQIDRWHSLAEDPDTYVIHRPFTCTREQLPAILDDYSKHVFTFGGNQSGKTQVGVGWLFDRMLLRKGQYLYLAPEQEKTQVGVEKLCRDTDFAQAVIPRELLASWPETARSGDQAVRWIDGRTVVQLRYCSRRGGNLKGLTGIRASQLDEGSEVQHEINFTIATNRLLMAGGQMIITTTPVAGHWLEKKNQQVRTYDEIEAAVAAGEDRPRAAKIFITCHGNPWISRKEVDITIGELGGPKDPRVRREVFGEWVSEGDRLWRQWDPERHLVEWSRREVEPYGFVNLTPIIAKKLFRGLSHKPEITRFYGQDFNYRPYSVAELMIIAARDCDHRDPNNWILYVNDEIIREARSTAEFAEWFTTQAGAWYGRGLPKSYFAGAHIVCDGTGFYRTRDARENATIDADAMRQAGCVVRAPRYTAKGRPGNPPRRVRIGFMNELMFRNRLLVNRQRCPGFAFAMDNEIGDGTGDTAKKPGSKADQISGITDGAGYGGWSALFRQPKKKADEADQPSVAAHWG